jgi:hypothetical protein
LVDISGQSDAIDPAEAADAEPDDIEEFALDDIEVIESKVFG